MERINVSEAFRFEQTNCNFKMSFNKKVNMEKVYCAMEAAIEMIKDETGYYKLWLQDLHDCCASESFEINSTLCCDEFSRYIPAMCKAVAEMFPTVPFSAFANFDDLRCFWIDEFDVSFNEKELRIKETFMDEDFGYFCPDCGLWIAPPYEEFESDEIECDDCEKNIKVADLKYVPAEVREETIRF